MSRRCGIVVLWGAIAGCATATAFGQQEALATAAAFGARPDATSVRVSPDGKTVAFISPAKGQGSLLYTVHADGDSKAKVALAADGKPYRLDGCSWVANDRLVCEVYAVLPDRSGEAGILPISRLVAVNADGSALKQLSNSLTPYARGYMLYGGDIVDWLPDQDGSVLMARNYLPDNHTGSLIGSDAEGLGIDQLDTRTLQVKHIITARRDVAEYLSDGRGTVRILGTAQRDSEGQSSGKLIFVYRPQGSQSWESLSTYNQKNEEGFLPIAVDHDLNVAYGWKQLNGRRALYTMTLDAQPRETLVYSRPDVDLAGLVRIGRRHRVVGVSYITERSEIEYLDADLKQMMATLHRALPKQPLIEVVDSSVDENIMVVVAGSDTDPGTYYLYDRKAHKLQSLLGVRPQLDGMKLATMKPVTYPGSDGVMIPGYLTLPAGNESAHGLPAIVLPHGGPSARDEWGFDWLVQYFAARGYAVLQPNYRGSAGYGNQWYLQNGFKSWNVAVGDVVAAGHWLVSSGIADPARLGIVGWSYGGYAALQSVHVDAGVYKAIIAIAPVTDLAALKEERRNWSDFELVSAEVGDGPHMHDGSPIFHVKEFKAPVLMFHGTNDRNVSVVESRRMADALKAAGVKDELVIFQDRDHQLEDSDDRADMLRRSDAFLRQAFGMSN